ncbi:unnamed protein product [Pseudo-nitzschia multistriata]|uniref:Coenzyme Q-binding protein COQ10 START domain-containing protein n=1 Tax=Pseudo-nitzschia multistriata TaxID=183589 RepID=A0A448Z4Y7_9STRA|nr:unnamed protein product [Pseudo-nitzschia multistriata]
MMPQGISTPARISSLLLLSFVSSLLVVSPLDALSSPHHTQWRAGQSESWTVFGRRSHRDSISRRRGNPWLRSLLLPTRMVLGETLDEGGSYEPIDDDDVFFGGSDEGESSEVATNKNKLIEIKSEIELPFSAEVAYDAYSDLPRQSSWSSWLESVEVVENKYTDNNGYNGAKKVESLWTSKMFGIRYSWTAVAVKNERPHTIQWRSVTGLRNEGIVRFYKREGKTYGQGPTLMTLRMAFVAPRAVSGILRRSKKLSRYVEEKMIAQSLQGFRDIVLKNDLEKEIGSFSTEERRHEVSEATTAASTGTLSE